MDNFQKNVFINCPFDADYRQLLISILFTVKFLGFSPRLTLQKLDAGTTRLENIVNLIDSSKFGIHDLSRILATKEGEHTRMNMPFELGIDYGCKKFKEGIWAQKKTLVLEKEPYRYQAALSDLSGSDIKNHNDEIHGTMYPIARETIGISESWTYSFAFATLGVITPPSRVVLDILE